MDWGPHPGGTRMDRRRFIEAALAIAAAPGGAALARVGGASLIPADAVAMVNALRRGQVSAPALVAAAVARLDKVNPRLNAVSSRNLERARAQARRRAGSMLGVPTFTKELQEEAGLPYSEGCRGYRDRLGATDGPAAVRMRQEGLISLARTTSPEFGLMPTTESLLHGPTRNPWNLEHSSGGSSGGSAALVAAGVAPFANASDGGGSIRIPASICGLVGLKASRGRWVGERERAKVIDFSVSAGCVSRTVRDTAAWFAAVEDRGPGARYAPVGVVSGPSPRRLRVGIALGNGLREADADVLAVCEQARLLLAKRGHKLVDAPLVYDGPALADAFELLWSVGAARNVGRLQAYLKRSAAPGDIEPYTAVLAERGARADKARVEAAVASLGALVPRYGAQFDAYDVLLTPVLGQAPVPIGWFGHTVPADTMRQRLTDYVGYTPVQNAMGVPAISLPVGFSRGGLPVGVQFVATAGGERTLLELAYELERELQWARQRPPVWAA